MFVTVEKLAECGRFRVINIRGNPERKTTKPFCYGLLSIAMGKALEGGAWATVMGNMNTLVVAFLADVAYVIMAEGAVLDEVTAGRTKQQETMALTTEEPISEATLIIHEMMHG